MEIRPISLSTGCSGEGVGTPVVIVTAANACFARSMCVAVHSALKHVPADRDVILYVLDDGIRPEDRARTLRVLHAARSNLTIEWIDPDLSLIEGLKKPEWHTRTTYLRFLIEYIVPAEHERVLYLDSDVVVQDDITKLWEFEMGDHPFWAVVNYYPSLFSNNLQKIRARIDPAPETTLYCNAGIMLLNMPRWREMGLSGIAIDFLARHGDDITFGDQDGLNAVLRGGWGLLDPEWNVQLLTVDRICGDHLPAADVERCCRDMLDHARILHYTGPFKPWHLRYRGYCDEAFFEAYRESGWASPLASALETAGLRISHAASRLLRQVRTAMFL
ncbi:glycosyltransferase family 8 protein [Amaricoccus macauensis]|uniref:glycosyltransferase family 8 protein n=1 Tax=Amaricoccus macauensis TaxID=57001 RepID=UPI003C7DFF32